MVTGQRSGPLASPGKGPDVPNIQSQLRSLTLTVGGRASVQSDMAGFSVIHTGNQGVGRAPSETQREILPCLTHPLMSGAPGLLLGRPLLCLPHQVTFSLCVSIFSSGPQPCWIGAHPAFSYSHRKSFSGPPHQCIGMLV